MSLTDEQWQYIQPFLPKPSPSRRGRPSDDPRAILDGIFWKFVSSCPWPSLPACYPPYKTCYTYYQEWYESHLLHEIVFSLKRHLKEVSGLDLELAIQQRAVNCVGSGSKARMIFPPEWEDWQAYTVLVIFGFVIHNLKEKNKRKAALARLQP